MTDVNTVLAERGSRYGAFSGHAAAAQQIKDVFREHLHDNPNLALLPDWQRRVLDEALDMIAHKLGRVVNGDPTYDDSWTDIAGYATLARDWLNTKTPSKGLEE